MQSEVAIPVTISFIAFCIGAQGTFLELILAKGTSIRDTTSITDRLAKLGKNDKESYENFRIAQLIYIFIALFLGSTLVLFSLISFQTYLGIIIASPVAVVFFTERSLTQRCARRGVEIESEFPAVVEMLTLAVGAGESPASALRRISSRAKGHMANEFIRVVDELEDGIPFTTSLDLMSRRLESEPIRRFVDSIIISISRGTSLVETLSHGANEARNQEKVRLLTAAGKSEISMMIPVVFLILPISILFALFPSLTNLNLFSN